jgi:hypothetical protein
MNGVKQISRMDLEQELYKKFDNTLKNNVPLELSSREKEYIKKNYPKLADLLERCNRM